MKNFSDIVIDNRPKDARIIDHIEQISGLPQEVCNSLLQRAKLNENWDPEKANEFFDDYFKISKPLDIDAFVEEVSDYVKGIGDSETDASKRRGLTNKLILLLKKYVMDTDTPSMLETVYCILAMKDSKDGKSLIESIRFGNESYKSLNESEQFELPKWNSLNILGTNYARVNDVNRVEDIYFYTELRHLLDERFKDYMSQPRNIQSTYETIMQYVVMKGEELEAQKILVETDERLYGSMIDSLLNSAQMDQRLLSPDYLKTITSDFQTLLFDLVVIVNSYVMQVSRKFGNYIDPFKYEEYFKALDLISKMIASSAVSSYLVNSNCCKCCDSKGQVLKQEDIPSYIPMQMWNLSSYINERNLGRIAQDCLLVISNIRPEFNIQIRKTITYFFSKAQELLTSLRKVDSQMSQTIVINN